MLHKALYGLKQSGHEWYKLLSEILDKVGHHQSVGDEGCFVNDLRTDSRRDYKTIIGTHVDDMLVIGPSDLLDSTELGIEGFVELDKRGRPEKMLGMELMWRIDEVTLTQRGLIESMTKTHLEPRTYEQSKKLGKGSSLPLDPKSFQPEDELADPKTCQAIVGGLLFITRMTRPEIAIQVNLLGRRAAKPGMQNLQAARQVLEYLYSTRYDGITLKRPITLDLKIHADAKYGGEKARSQTGVLVTLGNQPVGWYSRRQDIVSLSVTEAEYIAACEGAKDAAWGRQFLSELQIVTTPVLTTDSEGAFNLSKTNGYMRRTRHIDHRYHYIRQEIKKGHLDLQTIPGKENPADIFTKILPMSAVREWKKRWLGNSNPEGVKSSPDGTKD